MIKNAPYKYTEFVSLTFKYGLGDNLINQYNSKTGDYQYENINDSLIKTHVKLNKDDLLYIHRKAAELGFWNFPEVISGASNPKHSKNSPHFFLKLNYERKSKEVLFDLEYTKDVKLREAAKQLMDIVSQRINDAEQRDGNIP